MKASSFVARKRETRRTGSQSGLSERTGATDDSTASNLDVLKLFGFRCVRCGGSRNVQAHEIVPKSAIGEAAMEIENRVALCMDCHEWAHQVGTLVSGPILKELQEKALERFKHA